MRCVEHHQADEHTLWKFQRERRENVCFHLDRLVWAPEMSERWAREWVGPFTVRSEFVRTLAALDMGVTGTEVGLRNWKNSSPLCTWLLRRCCNNALKSGWADLGGVRAVIERFSKAACTRDYEERRSWCRSGDICFPVTGGPGPSTALFSHAHSWTHTDMYNLTHSALAVPLKNECGALLKRPQLAASTI